MKRRKKKRLSEHEQEIRRLDRQINQLEKTAKVRAAIQNGKKLRRTKMDLIYERLHQKEFNIIMVCDAFLMQAGYLSGRLSGKREFGMDITERDRGQVDFVEEVVKTLEKWTEKRRSDDEDRQQGENPDTHCQDSTGTG